jgi:hypothetical protein
MPPQPFHGANTSANPAGSGDTSPLAKEFPAWDLMPPAVLVRRRKRSEVVAPQPAAPAEAVPQGPPPVPPLVGSPPVIK